MSYDVIRSILRRGDGQHEDQRHHGGEPGERGDLRNHLKNTNTYRSSEGGVGLQTTCVEQRDGFQHRGATSCIGSDTEPFLLVDTQCNCGTAVALRGGDVSHCRFTTRFLNASVTFTSPLIVRVPATSFTQVARPKLYVTAGRELLLSAEIVVVSVCDK